MVGVHLYSFNIDLWFTPPFKAYKIYVRNYEHFSSSASQCNFSKYVYVWKEKMDLILLICNFLNDAKIKLASPIKNDVVYLLLTLSTVHHITCLNLALNLIYSLVSVFGMNVYEIKLYANKIFGNCFITHNICSVDLIWFILVLVG